VQLHCISLSRNTLFHSMINLLKPTGNVMHHRFNIQEFYILPHSIYEFFFIYLRTNSDVCPYDINCSVSITEMKSVYSAVRTGSLNKAVCASSLKGLTWERRVPAFNYRYIISRYQSERTDGLILISSYTTTTLGLLVRNLPEERTGSRVYSAIWVCVAHYR